MWQRVFSRSGQTPSPSGMVAALHEAGFPVIPAFKGDDLGWTDAELILPGDASPILIARYLTVEDDLRDDLNSYAAELETMATTPQITRLMERVIQSAQMFVMRKPVGTANESRMEALFDFLTRWLARETDGDIQVDGVGWNDKNGAMLLREV